jgi:hypothetical protein
VTPRAVPDPPSGPGSPADAARLPAVVRRLTDEPGGADGAGDDSRARLLLRLGGALAGSARQAGAAAVATGRWLTDTVVDLAPHIPIRDRETLSRQHGGLVGDQLADAVIESASRESGGIGAACGVLAGAEWTLPPALLSAPIQVLAETVAVVAVELKLVAELHEVYGRAPTGTPTSRASAYLSAWVRRRGVDPTAATGLAGDVISAAAKRQLRARLLRRTGSSGASVLPYFAGALAGATLNARATKRLGELVAADLVRRNSGRR